MCITSVPVRGQLGIRPSTTQCLPGKSVVASLPATRGCDIRRRCRLVAARAESPSSSSPAVSSNSSSEAASSSGNDQEEAQENVFAQLLKPLRDFGIGRTSLLQGAVGLFVFSGIGFGLMLVSWARSGQLGRRGQGYQAILEFPVACGISVGTPVRIRGVPVGGVLSVQPSLERVDVLVEIKDATTVIPRNSLIEANQSGLIAEPLIDITPQAPVPQYQGEMLGGWTGRCDHRWQQGGILGWLLRVAARGSGGPSYSAAAAGKRRDQAS